MKERPTQQGAIRKLYFSDEFESFLITLPADVRKKYDYTMDAVMWIYAIPEKFIKKLHNTNLYEMRVAVGKNAYRTVLFAMNHENLIEATQIVLLNSFMKKSTSDYRKEIAEAEKLLKKLTL